jgi:hypothetical protein
MSNSISQSQALGNLAKLLELKQIDQEMHDYLTKQLTTPVVVEFDPENPDMVARTFEVTKTKEELEQIHAENKIKMMSSSVIQFVGDSQTKDDWIRCLIGITKAFDRMLNFSEGNEKIVLTKKTWGHGFAPYDYIPPTTEIGSQDVEVELKFINKLADGVIQAEIVG